MRLHFHLSSYSILPVFRTAHPELFLVGLFLNLLYSTYYVKVSVIVWVGWLQELPFNPPQLAFFIMGLTVYVPAHEHNPPVVKYIELALGVPDTHP